MNSVLIDPDIKINMSLDEIIHLTRKQNRTQGPTKKKKRSRKRKNRKTSDHSVPLFSSKRGVGINVSKKSPLLESSNKRRIIQAINNKIINFDLIEKSKQIIPAEYKLIKTNTGVERILVPTTQSFARPQQKILSPLRKLNKPISDIKVSNKSFPENPPPLVAAPIYQPSQPRDNDNDNFKMEVDESDDEVVILDKPSIRKSLELIDVECDLPADVSGAKKLCMAPSTSSGFQTQIQPLNDHFTMLTGSFEF